MTARRLRPPLLRPLFPPSLCPPLHPHHNRSGTLFFGSLVVPWYSSSKENEVRWERNARHNPVSV